MTLSQIILLLSLLGIVLYVSRLRNELTDRLVMLVIIGLGAVFILWPELTTLIANRIGIGRGADMILYLFILFSLFFFVHTLAEINRLTKTVTTLAREIAIQNARFGHDHAESPVWEADHG